MDEQCSVNVTIVNALGLHARPAMILVDTAAAFSCDVRIRKGDTDVDGKSIMEVMLLAATRGTELEITATGGDAAQCCDELRELVARGFDED